MTTYRAGGCIIGLSLEREELRSWPESGQIKMGPPGLPIHFVRCGVAR